jgi:hypothetical protein
MFLESIVSGAIESLGMPFLTLRTLAGHSNPRSTAVLVQASTSNDCTNGIIILERIVQRFEDYQSAAFASIVTSASIIK